MGSLQRVILLGEEHLNLDSYRKEKEFLASLQPGYVLGCEMFYPLDNEFLGDSVRERTLHRSIVKRLEEFVRLSRGKNQEEMRDVLVGVYANAVKSAGKVVGINQDNQWERDRQMVQNFISYWKGEEAVIIVGKGHLGERRLPYEFRNRGIETKIENL